MARLGLMADRYTHRHPPVGNIDKYYAKVYTYTLVSRCLVSINK